jgi:hypothetical protein
MKAQTDARKQRLAAALRANLRRRKAGKRKPELRAARMPRNPLISQPAAGPEAATNDK